MSKKNCKNPFHCKDCKEYCVPAKTIYFKKDSNKLEEIYFFYNGYNLSITNDVEDFDSFLFNYYNSNKSYHEKSIQAYLNQLDLICSLMDANISNDLSDTTFAINVFVLTKMNVIMNDEENGLLYLFK